MSSEELSSPSVGSRYFETLVITAGAPVLGSLASSNDPYLLHAAFPWLLLAPLLAAGQHGLIPGFLSIGMLVGTAAWHASYGDGLPASFVHWAAGGVAIALLAGLGRELVIHKLRALSLRIEQLRERLEHSERKAHALSVSLTQLQLAGERPELAGTFDQSGHSISGVQHPSHTETLRLPAVSAQQEQGLRVMSEPTFVRTFERPTSLRAGTPLPPPPAMIVSAIPMPSSAPSPRQPSSLRPQRTVRSVRPAQAQR